MRVSDVRVPQLSSNALPIAPQAALPHDAGQIVHMGNVVNIRVALHLAHHASTHHIALSEKVRQ